MKSNRDFAVAGAIPPSAIPGAFNFKDPDDKKPPLHSNADYACKKPPCSGKKRDVCDSASAMDDGPTKKGEADDAGKKTQSGIGG